MTGSADHRAPRAAIAACIGLTLLGPALLWLAAVGNPLDYLGASVPDGQLLYVLSKLSGLCAVALLALQLSLTLLRATRPGRSFLHWSSTAHARLGAAVLLASALHVVAFVSAASLRSGHLAGHLLLPRWRSGFYDAMVSVGVIALALLLVAAGLGAFARRRRRSSLVGPRAARHTHRVLVLVLVPLVLAHSYAIGSETDTLPGRLFYTLVAIVVIIGIGCGLRRLQRPGRHGGNERTAA